MTLEDIEREASALAKDPIAWDDYTKIKVLFAMIAVLAKEMKAMKGTENG